MKNLHVHLNSELYLQLKIMAARRGTTLTDIVRGALVKVIEQPPKIHIQQPPALHLRNSHDLPNG